MSANWVTAISTAGTLFVEVLANWDALGAQKHPHGTYPNGAARMKYSELWPEAAP